MICIPCVNFGLSGINLSLPIQYFFDFASFDDLLKLTEMELETNRGIHEQITI